MRRLGFFTRVHANVLQVPNVAKQFTKTDLPDGDKTTTWSDADLATLTPSNDALAAALALWVRRIGSQRIAPLNAR